MNYDYHDTRRDETGDTLEEQHAGDDPLALFARWMEDAHARSGEEEPTACSLATLGPDGAPALRMVLLRSVDAGRFVFHTHFGSRKGRDLEGDDRAALCFFWSRLHRQVRIEGRVERWEAERSDAYFASRPRGSQIGAWASPQSEVLDERQTLEALVAETEARFEGQEVPRPSFWGGLALVPDALEFWQGRRSRLHDRLRFERAGDSWSRVRLAP